MRKTLAAALIFCATPAFADWTPFFETARKDTVFYDPTTIRGEKTKRVWAKAEFKNPTPMGSKSLRVHYEIDCNAGQVRVLASQSFQEPNLMGGPLSVGGEEGWTYPAPQTSTFSLFKIICGKKP